MTTEVQPAQSLEIPTAVAAKSPAVEIRPEDDPQIGLRRWTRADYYRMAEVGLLDSEERVELLEGEIWKMMSPQATPHATAIRLVTRELRAAFGSTLGEACEVTQQLPITLNNRSEPEPDVLVTIGHAQSYGDHHPGPEEIRLLVEVSDSTLKKDRTRKAKLYAQAGIADYWIVNLIDRTLEVYRDPSPDGTYSSMFVYGPADSVSPLAATQAAIPVASLLPAQPGP